MAGRSQPNSRGKTGTVDCSPSKPDAAKRSSPSLASRCDPLLRRKSHAGATRRAPLELSALMELNESLVLTLIRRPGSRPAPLLLFARGMKFPHPTPLESPAWQAARKPGPPRRLRGVVLRRLAWRAGPPHVRGIEKRPVTTGGAILRAPPAIKSTAQPAFGRLPQDLEPRGLPQEPEARVRNGPASAGNSFSRPLKQHPQAEQNPRIRASGPAETPAGRSRPRCRQVVNRR